MRFDYSGKYESPAYGQISVICHEGKTILAYHSKEWLLNFKDDRNAEFILLAFGLQIPLPVQFEVDENQKVKKLSIPFSLDPRVPAEAFTLIS